MQARNPHINIQNNYSTDMRGFLWFSWVEQKSMEKFIELCYTILVSLSDNETVKNVLGDENGTLVVIEEQNYKADHYLTTISLKQKRTCKPLCCNGLQAL